jgi:HlyD family secretion protein
MTETNKAASREPTESNTGVKEKLDKLLGEDQAKPLFKRPVVWIGVALLIAAGLGFWWWQIQKAARAKPLFHTQAARLGDVTLSVIANGTLQPIRTYAIGSELSGTVSRVHVDVNDRVSRGQILVELDTSKLRDQIARTKATLYSARASVAQANATRGQAQANLNRLQKVWQLSQGQVPAQAELDIARADVDRAAAAGLIAAAGVRDAQAALSTDETNLSKASIRAPADGVVLTRTVEPGNAVAASFQSVTLLTLASDLARLRVWGYVDEADVGSVRVGQEATFTVSAFLDRTFPAQVTRVGSGSTITDNVVTYLTYLDVANDDLMLRPGMTATATIIAKRHKNVLLVPNMALRFTPSQAVTSTKPKQNSLLSALTPRVPGGRGARKQDQASSVAGAKKVYILRDGAPVSIAIQTGLSDGQMTEIIGGNLKAGMPVITDQQAAPTP